MFTANELLIHRAYLLAKLRGWVRHDAEDLTQETLLRAWQARGRFLVGQLRPWLFTIARRLAVSHTMRRRQFVTLTSMKAVQHTPDKELIRKETAEIVRQAITKLRNRQRRAIVLRYHDGHTYDEIAREMSLSIKAVKSLLARSKARLRSQLAQPTPQPHPC
jgi:RNA polymerase sigma-70 factor (ECF subfamily)